MGRGYLVRVMVRPACPGKVNVWPDVELRLGDALGSDSLDQALEGVHTLYHLIHSLELGGRSFATAELQAAKNVRLAAELGRGPVPVTVLRAAIIIGSGSASFLILRHLVRKAPVILLPRWAKTECQPVGIRDVLRTLVGVLEVEATAGKTFDIGGPEVLTYERMLRVLADVLGYRRLFAPSPVSSMRLYSYLVSRLVPIPAPVCRLLMQSIRDTVVCEDDEIETHLAWRRQTYREALLAAIAKEKREAVLPVDREPSSNGLRVGRRRG